MAYYIKSLLHNQYCREVALCVCLLCTRKSLVPICSAQPNGSNNRPIKYCCFQQCVQGAAVINGSWKPPPSGTFLNLRGWASSPIHRRQSASLLGLSILQRNPSWFLNDLCILYVCLCGYILYQFPCASIGVLLFSERINMSVCSKFTDSLHFKCVCGGVCVRGSAVKL